MDGGGWVFRKSCKIGAATITLYVGKVALLLQGPENQVNELTNKIANAIDYTAPETGDDSEGNSRSIRSLKRDIGGRIYNADIPGRQFKNQNQN